MNAIAQDRKKHRNYLGLALALGLLVITYISFFSWQSWEDESAHSRKELHTIMEMGEQGIDQYFKQIDTAMQSLAFDLGTQQGDFNHELAYQAIKRFRDLRPELGNVTLLQFDGQILYSAKTPPGKPVPTADKRYFNELPALLKEDTFVISAPFYGQISKQWLVPLRRVIKNTSGQPLYVLGVYLPVEFLQKFWQDAPISSLAAMGLIRDDGLLLSRFPIPAKAKLEDVYGKPRTGALIAHLRQAHFPTSGVVIGPSSLDGPDFLNFYRRLDRYPLTLFIALPMASIRQEWWNKVKVPYLFTLLLLVVGAGLFSMAQRRQRQLDNERARMDQLKAEFISAVSHELRTPVTSIRGALGLIEGGVVGEVSAGVMKLVKVAHKNSQRLIALVNDILDMEKLLSGKMSLKIENLDLLEVIAQSLEANAAYAEELGVHYSFEPGAGMAKVKADPDRLHQVLANLLSNAAKFSAKGETVTIRIAAREKSWYVAVEDRGCGIPIKFRDHIFGAFAQANSGNTRQQGGTGLGLHISKTLIENMGGSIGFESEVDVGTTFWFTLPAA